MNAAEALEDARRVRRETEARQAEVDALAAQLAAMAAGESRRGLEGPN
jgi:hypothetical protein